MIFNYVSVFKIEGMSLPEGTEQIIIGECSTPQHRVILTRNPDNYCNELDTYMAIGTLTLQVFAGPSSTGTFEQRLSVPKSAYTENRKKRIGDSIALIFEASGNTEVDLSSPSHDHGEFAVTFGGFDRNKIKGMFETHINRAITSVFLTTGGDFSIENIGEVIYLKDEVGKITYSIVLEMHATMTSSKVLQPHEFESLKHRWEVLKGQITTDDIQRLLIQASSQKTDNFRRFLSAWTAFEIFLNKLFKLYEEHFLAGSVVCEAPALATEFVTRLKKVMSDKYTLKDKFIVICSTLSSSSAENDLKTFIKAKKMRDHITHGERIDEEQLPTQEVIKLLQQYLALHLDAVGAESPRRCLPLALGKSGIGNNKDVPTRWEDR